MRFTVLLRVLKANTPEGSTVPHKTGESKGGQLPVVTGRSGFPGPAIAAPRCF